MHKKGAIITIDGPSGSGKSTISKQLAAKLRYTFLDTGAMYRAVGLKVERAGIDLADTVALEQMLAATELRLVPTADEHIQVFLDGEDVSLAIRTAAMGLVASKVSAHPAVRNKLTLLQREMGRKGGVVAEGRDTGTVVFPEADCKFFLDASPAERARRRCAQLLEKGQEADYAEILAQIKQRDHDDSTRTHAPLKPAADAVIIDSSTMSIDEVVAFMLERVGDP
jgi:cytidylate kinase